MHSFTHARSAKVRAAMISTLMAGTLCLAPFAAYADESASASPAQLSIAYQYGLGYAPATIAQQLHLIEDAYRESTGGELEITWNQMSSGADINTGIAAGEIDAGFMGIGPAVAGISKNLGYKIFSNLSGQEHGLLTNDDSIQGFEDLIGSDYQIALVNIGSYQHILLARALDEAGYDAHALDSNIVAMKHPDGMASLLSGSVAVHLTTNPYLYQERADDSLHEVAPLYAEHSPEDSFLVGIASETIHDEDPALYDALCTGLSEAMDLINNDLEAAAEITVEFDGNTLEDEILYLGAGSYSSETAGLEEFARFMYDHQFLDNDPGSYEDLVFDNVTGD